MRKIFTLGHEGSKPSVIRSILVDNKISHLIDIRRDVDNILNRFNRETLTTLCQDLSIEYIHAPGLAPSKSLIKEAKEREEEIKALFPAKKKKDREIRYVKFRDYYQGAFRNGSLEKLPAMDTTLSAPLSFCF